VVTNPTAQKKLWFTYAWKDNQDEDVDHIINVLRGNGLDVNFDRRQIIPGQRLWSQINAAISDPTRCDAWAIFATKASLSSEPCLEELAYALDRALRVRGSQFSLIGIFPEPLDRALIPSAIATRLYVNLCDPEWARLVRDGVNQSRTGPDLSNIPSFVAVLHQRPSKKNWSSKSAPAQAVGYLSSLWFRVQSEHSYAQ
jgi:hypothetical protein